MMWKEVFISVDIEADGPIPGDYSMLALGAVVVERPHLTFYRELKPIREEGDPDTVRWLKEVAGLDREKFKIRGSDPKQAMGEFRRWLRKVCGLDGRPVFVAFNATYDWMFVYWYLVHFTGAKPFGISGLDIKAYYMGLLRKRRWQDTARHAVDPRFLPDSVALPHTHNALDDAREQAEIFRRLKEYAEREERRKGDSH